ncbi:MAG: SsrA-binding protein SmpB [Caldisericia bacterium]|nr:SsrA-binding protein SmpB [Caldisericia bacterium]MDD4614297.1 SsrA-binding protein SmpB [Caldisericia bacterium]
MKQEHQGLKSIAMNKKAFHDYHILQKMEAGIVLTGPEIKAIRAGRVNFIDSYVSIDSGQPWLYNLHIQADVAYGSYQPTQKRKLLLHKKEIHKISQKVLQKGLTIIPLQVVLKNQWAKVIIALAQGKTKYDKRQALKKKEERRELRNIV